MRKVIIGILMSFCLFGMYQSLWANHSMHPLKQIAFVKKMIGRKQEPYHTAYVQLIRYADSIQQVTHHARNDFAVPGYYVKPEEHRANSLALQQDAFAAYCSALAYRLSGKKRYGEKACYFMNAWATINKKYSEPDGPLVMSYSGSAFLMAAELMDDTSVWDADEKQLFKDWVTSVYRKATNEIRERKNNWADWGRLGSLLVASFLDDKEEIERNIKLIKGDLGDKIASDGHMPEEVRRGKNGLWYTYFSLAPMTASFWVTYNLTGENLFLWEQEGKSVKKALDYLLRYQKSPSEWKWYEGPNVGTHATWPDNLLEAMAGIYGESAYGEYVENSRPHIYPVHHFAWVFPTLMPLSLSGYNQGGQSFVAKKDADIEKLRKRFAMQLLSASVSDSRIKTLLETLQPDGSWPGIDYVDTTRTAFQHERHLSNMLALSIAYQKKGSPYKGNKQVSKAVHQALAFWLENDFICENWWWNQIGTPNTMVSLLLILDRDLSPEESERMLKIAERGNINAWGARPSGDRIKIAGLQAKAALFKRDVQEVAMLMKVIEGEIKFSTERGMQHDFSFHHRTDWVNNTLSYGSGYASAFIEWASNVADTKFRFSEQAVRLLIDYYLDGICKQMVYGRISDPGILNRDITRPGEERVWSPSDPEKLRNLTDYRQAELDNIICLRKGDSSCRPGSFAKFFWRTDHFVFQRPDFYTSVRMYSTRNANMEEPYNGEGLMNHFRGDGTNYLSVRGDEYKRLTPVYDWMKIPGATIVQLDKMPGENEIQKWGLTDYVGAVTDGTYGAVGLDFKSPHTGLAAKKVWFFFDKTYVCLGTNISSRMKNQVLTTVNQCLLNGQVTVSDADGIHPQERGSRMKKGVRWVVHDRVGYYFLNKENVILSNQRTEGSWKIANRQTTTPTDIIQQDVFTLSVDHGSYPNNEGYAYMVVPSADPLSIEKQVEEEGVVVLANCPDVQAVRHDGLNMAYAVFYKGGTLRIHDKIVVEMDAPGMLMVKYNDAGEILTLGVSDPTRFMKKLHLSVNQRIVGTAQENIQTEWDGKQALTRISVDLPQNEYAGKSVIYNK